MTELKTSLIKEYNQLSENKRTSFVLKRVLERLDNFHSAFPFEPVLHPGDVKEVKELVKIHLEKIEPSP